MSVCVYVSVLGNLIQQYQITYKIFHTKFLSSFSNSLKKILVKIYYTYVQYNNVKLSVCR